MKLLAFFPAPCHAVASRRRTTLKDALTALTTTDSDKARASDKAQETTEARNDAYKRVKRLHERNRGRRPRCLPRESWRAHEIETVTGSASTFVVQQLRPANATG